MPDGQVLEFDRVTKRFGDTTAVSDFSGRVEPGVVTGFLGPNGAGKTTTLLMLLGQIRPSSGTATIGGAQYSELKHPARIIGAMYEDPGFRPRRTVERHLAIAAKANGLAPTRVAEVIGFVGLDGEAHSRIGTLSLGMRQRLSAATALLGDPGALVLDEPANGLDPEGIRWMRMLIRGLADEGRTVLVSSHVLSEVEQVADEILVIAHGERKFAGSLASLADPTSGPVVVDAVDRTALSGALTGAGFDFEVLRSGLTVRGSDATTIGGVAANAGVALTTLQQRGPTLEDVFLDLVNGRPVNLRQPDAPDATRVVPVVTEAEAPEEAAAADAVVPAEEVAADEQDAPAEDVPAEETGPIVPASTDAADVPAEEAADEQISEGDSGALTPDGDEDDVAADEVPFAAFAPVSGASDRPLPGAAGFAAAAAGFAQRGEGSDEPTGEVSNAWAALVTGTPFTGSPVDDTEQSQDASTPDEADAHASVDESTEAPAEESDLPTASEFEWTAEPEPAAEASAEPTEDEGESAQESADEEPASDDAEQDGSAEPEYTEFAHEQHVAEDEHDEHHGEHRSDEHRA